MLRSGRSRESTLFCAEPMSVRDTDLKLNAAPTLYLQRRMTELDSRERKVTRKEHSDGELDAPHRR